MTRTVNVLKVGGTGGGKTLSAALDVVNSPDEAAVILDPHKQSLAEAVLTHATGNVLFDRLSDVRATLGYELLAPSAHPDAFRRQLENQRRAEAFVAILLRRRNADSVASTPLLEEWTHGAIALYLAQATRKPLAWLPFAFLPGTAEFRSLVGDCTDGATRHKFAQLEKLSPRALRAEVGSTSRLVDAVFRSLAFTTRARGGLDLGWFLQRRGKLIVERGEDVGDDTMRAVVGAVVLLVVDHAKRRPKPVPPIRVYIDEATNAWLVGGPELPARHAAGGDRPPQDRPVRRAGRHPTRPLGVTPMAIEDLWYKNAVIYCLDVETYLDANGDGVGDFEGLGRRLEYLAGLGVTCVWLQPFYNSPNRDNGYDVSDYYSVHEKHGSLGDFVEFMNHARALGVRVVVDLVVSHTSVEHPWFRSARSGPESPYHDWYVWADERPANHEEGVVFPGVQTTTWTYDERAKKYYFHRFYEHQADLNTHHPAVREEIRKVMGFWLELGVSGFRLDAVPFLIERKGAGVEPVKDYELLHEMRDFLQWRCRDAVLLAEANVPPDESLGYFGAEGDHLQMMLNFPVNQRLFYALATADLGPLRWALEQTAARPHAAQWVQFLRSHDELDLGRLTDDQRERVFQAFAPDEGMRLYGRGVRRRLAPMLGNDRRRLELAYSLLFALPGTPMLQYGDEIGLGDDLSLPERECARTPMQWSGERHGGFSWAGAVVRPVIDDAEYGYRKVNAADQRRDRGSLLNWLERVIRARKECPEISWGEFTIVPAGVAEVLALRCDWRGTSLVTVHNFAGEPRTARLRVGVPGGERLADVCAVRESRAGASGEREIELEPYGHRWFRVGAADNALNRASREEPA